MEDIDTNELFTIGNQFYTGQHRRVLAHQVSQYSAASQPKVLEYLVRSSVALAQDASPLLEHEKLQQDHEALLLVLQEWNDLQTFGTESLTYFDDVAQPEFATQAVLTALYLVKYRHDLELAAGVLQGYIAQGHGVLDLEPYLLLVQLHLHRGNLKEAVALYDRFAKMPYAARDDIVYHVLESWINSARGGFDAVSNAHYFYDELLAGDLDDDPQAKFRVLSAIFALTLQLKHLPEAKEVLAQVLAVEYLGPLAADLLANRIAHDYLTAEGAHVAELVQQLSELSPGHAVLADYADKNERFDAIVEKYLGQDVALV